MWTWWIHARDSRVHFWGRRHLLSCRCMSGRIYVVARWFLSRRWLPLRRSSHRVSWIVRLCWRRRLRRILNLSNGSRPVSNAALRSLRMLRWHCLWSSGTPLWSRGNAHAVLVGLWVYILWHWGIVLVGPCRLSTSKQLQARFNVNVRWVQLSSPGVCIKGIICLIVT